MHAAAHPATMGAYRILRSIGRGGMAELFLAVAQGPGGFTKLAVIKRIWPELASDPDFVAMFTDEARLSARLSHPHIVQTFDLGMERGRPFLAMEYLDGQPFSQVLNRLRAPGALPFALRLRVLADVLAALDYAHDLRDYDGRPLGVVHRDVSPHNIFITYDGTPKLIDFGIAKTLAASHHTRPGVLKGRLAYMAPEQLRAGATVDRRADVFAVGIMLWEAIAGQRMWRGKEETEIARALITGEVPPPVYDPNVPDDAYAVCERALSVDPEARYQTAAELQLAIDRLIGAAPESRSRELARVVSHAFELERARTNALIERALRAPTPDDASAEPWAPPARATGSFSVGDLPAASPPPLPPAAGRRAWITPVRLVAAAAAVTGALWLVAPAPAHREEPRPAATTLATVPPPVVSAAPAPAAAALPAPEPSVLEPASAPSGEVDGRRARRLRRTAARREVEAPHASRARAEAPGEPELSAPRRAPREIDTDDPYEARGTR